MKKVFSMFLILVMILPLLPANAQDSSCLIEFNGAEPEYSMSGTHAFISGHHNDDAITASYGDTTGWVLNPTEDKTAEGYGYQTICINLPNSYMNELPGTQDVLMDVRYYDGAASDSGRRFCVYYDSKNHYHETAGIVTLTGSGEWKTHTFTLEKPRLRDIGNTPLMNIGITVSSSYMTSKGSVTIASADVYLGEERDLFLSLESENVGNIFFGNDPVELSMVMEKNPYTLDHGDLNAKFTLTNKFDGSIYRADRTVPVGDSDALTYTVSLDDLNLPFGIYNVTADIYSGDTLIVTDTTALSRVSSKTDYEPAGEDGVNNSFHGFNTHAVLNEYGEDSIKDLVYLAEKSGAGFIRETLVWADVEPEPGEYQIPENYMTLLEEAKARNLKVMLILGNFNSDAYPNSLPWRTDESEESQEKFQNFLNAYSNFVKYAVSELGDEVECWEILNEYTQEYPGYQGYQSVHDVPDDLAKKAAVDYADILKAGFAAARSVDPDARVIGGAFAGLAQTESHMGTLYREHEAGQHMDAISYHYYPGNNAGNVNTVTNRARNLRNYMGEMEVNNEIYLDEVNFTTQQGLGEMDIAIYNTRYIIKARYEEDIDRIYSYCLESKSYNLGNGYGFVERPVDSYDYLAKTSAARPNYALVTFMNKLLRLSDNVYFTEDADGNHIYEFYDNIHERPVYAIWNNNDADSSVTIEDYGTELFAYDMYGNQLGTAEDSITVATGKEPVYVAGPEKDFLMGDGDDTYKVTINGTGTVGNNISIVVLNKGLTEEDFGSVSQILYANQSVISPGGEWSFTFKITQGNGEYEVLLAEENGESYVYNLDYNAGKLRVGYELSQEQGSVESFSSLADGNLDIDYRIDNPENKNTGFVVFGCLYKGDELVKVVKSEDGQLSSNELIKTGSITIPAVKKADIDKVQIMVFDGTDNVRPLVKKFVLE